MMGSWDLRALRRALPQLNANLTLIVGDRDMAVPPPVAEDVRASLPAAQIVTLPGLGHLAHEERPDLVARVIVDVARAHGLLEGETA
jgi:magnesium chelatase accessory protein